MKPETSPPPRATMNGKPVHLVPAKTVINFQSGFGKKLLCDDLTFSLGTACAYTCTFCYVPSAMRKTVKPLLDATGLRHEDLVIRRTNAIDLLRAQLLRPDGTPRYSHPFDRRVIYSSPLVDVAANMELVRETIEACKLILEHTRWQIRLLSKSHLLPEIAAALSEWARDLGGDRLVDLTKARMIFGVSTGTLDDKLAAAFEQGTPLVSKRIASLHRLQDHGYRTFGMICPSLPSPNDLYSDFAIEMEKAIRGHLCEHVWAEVINVRGDSMTATVAALNEAGFRDHATALYRTSTDKEEWDYYARKTFEAHAPLYAPGKLRFLQYVTEPFGHPNPNRPYWESQQSRGAILL